MRRPKLLFSSVAACTLLMASGPAAFGQQGNRQDADTDRSTTSRADRDDRDQDRGEARDRSDDQDRQRSERDRQERQDRQRSQRDQDSQRSQRDRQTQGQQARNVTVRGEVVNQKTVPIRNTNIEHRVVRIETEDGERRIVDLGPTDQVRRLNIQEGDEIEVRGTPVMAGEQRIVAAREVSADDQTVQVRYEEFNIRGDRQDRQRLGQRLDRQGDRDRQDRERDNQFGQTRDRDGRDYTTQYGQDQDDYRRDRDGRTGQLRDRGTQYGQGQYGMSRDRDTQYGQDRDRDTQYGQTRGRDYTTQYGTDDDWRDRDSRYAPSRDRDAQVRQSREQQARGTSPYRDQLDPGRSGRPGGLGVTLASRFRGEGVLVTDVTDDSPANEAGIQAGDRIILVDDQYVDEPQDLIDEIASTRPGSRVRITLSRNGQERSVRARLVPRLQALGYEDQGNQGRRNNQDQSSRNR